MRLNKVIISGFRSVKNEEILRTDERTTILIGANDHGKTNLLAAIQCLNDDMTIKPTDRHWDLKAEDDVVIKWVFSLDDNDLLFFIDQFIPSLFNIFFSFEIVNL